MLSSQEIKTIESNCNLLENVVRLRDRIDPTNEYGRKIVQIYERLHGPICKTCPDAIRDAFIIVKAEYIKCKTNTNLNTSLNDGDR